MRWTRLSLVILVALCSSTANAQTFSISGTMQHSTVEGGCWYLQANDGKQYELTGDQSIIDQLHVAGQSVDLSVESVKGAASVCMVGQIVHVVAIESLRRMPYDPPTMDQTMSGTVRRTRLGTWYLQVKKMRFEFKEPPPKSKRRVGAKMHGRFLLLLNPRDTKEKMDGVILSERTPAKPKMAPGKQYDPR